MTCIHEFYELSSEILMGRGYLKKGCGNSWTVMTSLSAVTCTVLVPAIVQIHHSCLGLCSVRSGLHSHPTMELLPSLFSNASSHKSLQVHKSRMPAVTSHKPSVSVYSTFIIVYVVILVLNFFKPASCLNCKSPVMVPRINGVSVSKIAQNLSCPPLASSSVDINQKISENLQTFSMDACSINFKKRLSTLELQLMHQQRINQELVNLVSELVNVTSTRLLLNVSPPPSTSPAPSPTRPAPSSAAAPPSPGLPTPADWQPAPPPAIGKPQGAIVQQRRKINRLANFVVSHAAHYSSINSPDDGLPFRFAASYNLMVGDLDTNQDTSCSSSNRQVPIPDPYPRVNWAQLNRKAVQNLPVPSLFPVLGCAEHPDFYKNMQLRCVGVSCACIRCTPPFGRKHGFLTDLRIIAVPSDPIYGNVFRDGTFIIHAEASTTGGPGWGGS